jgi:hypothetical protein
MSDISDYLEEIGEIITQPTLPISLHFFIKII